VSESFGVHSAHTLPMSVHNTGFMLDRLGQDCSPLQFLREITENAVQAVHAMGENGGHVIWDVDWNRLELAPGVFKVACIDTGIGMTGPEMLRYINMLSSSMHQQSHGTNFGVGAKVAAATRNHAGLVYLSWKDGIGSMIHLWRDPDTAQYGLKRFELPDGSYAHWVHVEDTIKPEPIDENGTMVVLLGNDLDDDSMQAPKGAPSPSRWVARYLNTRYFRFPDGVEVRAREGWEYPRSNTDTHVLRRITGQQEYLDAHAEAAGTRSLSTARAHWWILRDESALSQNFGLHRLQRPHGRAVPGRALRDGDRSRGRGTAAAVRRDLRLQPGRHLRRTAGRQRPPGDLQHGAHPPDHGRGAASVGRLGGGVPR
jgi:hypothetical protein